MIPRMGREEALTGRTGRTMLGDRDPIPSSFWSSEVGDRSGHLEPTDSDLKYLEIKCSAE